MSALVTTNTAGDVQAFHQKHQCFDWRLSQENLKNAWWFLMESVETQSLTVVTGLQTFSLNANSIASTS